jgi:hypothetical protein
MGGGEEICQQAVAKKEDKKAGCLRRIFLFCDNIIENK